MKELKYQGTVKRWDMFEVAFEGPKEGNPFTEQEVRAEFCGDQETVSCDGFYDGEGIYRVRFMPSFEGEYSFTICRRKEPSVKRKVPLTLMTCTLLHTALKAHRKLCISIIQRCSLISK